jgi:hypothetical protein
LSTKARVESDFYASFGMGGCFAGWLAGRIDSLGLAVKAHGAPSLVVPSRYFGTSDPYGQPPTSIPGIGIGLGVHGVALDLDASHLANAMPNDGSGATSRPVSLTSASVGSSERESEDGSSLNNWRVSDESPRARMARVNLMADGGYGRRGSEPFPLSHTRG